MLCRGVERSGAGVNPAEEARSGGLGTHGRLVFIGPHVRDPIQWRVIEAVCETLALDGVAVAEGLAQTENEEHRQWSLVETPRSGSPIREIRPLPRGRRTTRALRVLRLVRSLDPAVVILTAEPHERVILDVLAALVLHRRPVVIALAMENRVRLPGGWRGFVIKRLWKRIDGIAAGASATVLSYRLAGMPKSIPWVPLVSAVADPEPAGDREVDDADGLLVGYVGRLVEEKGVLDLVAAVERCPDVSLILAGPGPLEAVLRARADEPGLRGRMTVLGIVARSRVWELLREIDCLALLSRTEDGWSEQFGYVLAEAMAVGTPIIGSSSGAIPEVVGPAGLIVPERSPEEAAVAVMQLKEDPELRRSLGSVARERYRSEFSIEACAAKLADLVETCLTTRRCDR